ncbi:hypothetical protein GGTG_08691 [Gaeumannomyces tritici R3-111a-1]|uniref:Uncharacterized protein n=1 Tax=Gaeumannomyces tritici (strain R3-111a-1) TaxID=644352 RepID=J3P5A2_GAET3|nr:hypothetical protein GGTG_08691 [Gaeumannomyces tritici R3-111a-1]EJT74853.1 hypothetical protein GGTG_08691 [Gaeumannomyces tritici R3-111a-1]
MAVYKQHSDQRSLWASSPSSAVDSASRITLDRAGAWTAAHHLQDASPIGRRSAARSTPSRTVWNADAKYFSISKSKNPVPRKYDRQDTSPSPSYLSGGSLPATAVQEMSRHAGSLAAPIPGVSIFRDLGTRKRLAVFSGPKLSEARPDSSSRPPAPPQNCGVSGGRCKGWGAGHGNVIS